MDLGATICTPKSPKCYSCPINEYCEGYKKGDASNYPIKKKKAKIPERHAVAYIYIDDGRIGVERRPEKGMLGGMVGFPTSEWININDNLPKKIDKNFKIRHVFTHFALTLYPVIIKQPYSKMINYEEIDVIGLPTLFQKLWNVVKSEI
jgi:A/G-specific adenine glycosylase